MSVNFCCIEPKISSTVLESYEGVTIPFDGLGRSTGYPLLIALIFKSISPGIKTGLKAS